MVSIDILLSFFIWFINFRIKWKRSCQLFYLSSRKSVEILWVVYGPVSDDRITKSADRIAIWRHNIWHASLTKDMITNENITHFWIVQLPSAIYNKSAKKKIQNRSFVCSEKENQNETRTLTNLATIQCEFLSFKNLNFSFKIFLSDLWKFFLDV